MSWSWEEVGVAFVGILLAGSASVLSLRILRPLGLPDAYALVVGLSVALPLLLYASRSSLRIDPGAYFDARGRTGSAIDAVLVVIGGAVGGCAVTFALLQSGLPEPWPRSAGVGAAVLAANGVFIRRNRSYFDGNPWVGGKLGEWLDE